MIFTKSFDYALRGVLYVSLMSGTKKRILIEEVSSELSIPNHFLRKIMNKLTKKKIIDSTKGPFGGLSINDGTKKTTLLELLKSVDSIHPFNSCVLKMKKCNDAKPCILHDQMSALRDEIHEILVNTTIDDMINGSKPELLQKLTTY